MAVVTRGGGYMQNVMTRNRTNFVSKVSSKEYTWT